MKKTALITGVTGQDGAYLAEFLLEKGYEVHGIRRRASSFNTERVDSLYGGVHADTPGLLLHYGDMTDAMNLSRLVAEIRPDEIYNLAARVMFRFPLTCRNTRPKWMPLARCAYSKLSV